MIDELRGIGIVTYRENNNLSDDKKPLKLT